MMVVLFIAGYPLALALLMALDCLLGWPLAEAYGRPHPEWCPFPSIPTRAHSAGPSMEA